MRTGALIASLAALSSRLPQAPVGELAALGAELRGLEATLAEASDAALDSGEDGAAARFGIDAGQVAIRLGIAAKALRTAAAADREDIVRVNRTLAWTSVLDAMAPLGRLLAAGAPERDWSPRTGTQEAAAQPEGSAPPAHVLTNICRYHREHERFYVQDRTFVAGDLHREANKLKIVAEAWQRNAPAMPDPGIDYSDPAYAAAGCTDLNASSAIAMIGVLFMEGEQEPIEIRVLKARLTALAASWRRAGEWLSAKMEAAWDRERAMYRPGLVAVAHQRFNTIVMNWRGSRERLLAARTLEMAMRVLDSIPFEPQRIRADRAALGGRLFEAGAILGLTAQLLGRTAADLADNDANWTDCIRHLEAAPAAG
jgi:hypothetical protein